MKKIFSLLLVFCMLFGLVACGNNSNNSNNVGDIGTYSPAHIEEDTPDSDDATSPTGDTVLSDPLLTPPMPTPVYSLWHIADGQNSGLQIKFHFSDDSIFSNIHRTDDSCLLYDETETVFATVVFKNNSENIVDEGIGTVTQMTNMVVDSSLYSWNIYEIKQEDKILYSIMLADNVITNTATQLEIRGYDFDKVVYLAQLFLLDDLTEYSPQ